MSEENNITKIAEKDLLFVEKEFSKTDRPLPLYEITKKLAYQKTSSQLSQEVKKYDSYCQYEVGDFIYKEYDEPLMVSSKGMEPFKGAVILKVIGKVPYEDFNCEMLEVDYSGGGVFRKYIDYMKKSKTQVLLPSNLDKKAKIPEKMQKEQDPRLTQLPMTDRELKILEKNLKRMIAKSSKFFNWNEHWQLTEKQMEIPQKKIKDIETHLLKTKQSAATSEIVNRYFEIEPSDNLFELCCISLNSCLEKAYKKEFVYVSPIGWGKWILKKTLQSYPEKLPLSAPKATLPSMEEKEIMEITQAPGFPLKIYLTLREIHSGGIKIPKYLNKELSHAREYIFTDIEEEKDYIVFYYPTSNFFLGLKDFYEKNNVPQGASLTLERKGPAHFNFWLKKSKKKLSVPKITYDAKEDKFIESKGDVFTFALPNKIIHLERETLTKLLSHHIEKTKRDLKALLILVFTNFGLESKKFFLHFLRAYHLVDILKNTTQRDVETSLLGLDEFFQSEKNKGVFFYTEKIEAEQEVKPAVLAEEKVEEAITEALLPEAQVPEVPVEEISPPEITEERKEVRVEAQAEVEEIEFEEKEELREPPTPGIKPKREKAVKKKRVKVEAERAPRLKKGAKKIIEERIELEEFEQEALTAVKAKEKREVEAEEEFFKKEKKGKFKPLVSEEPAFGIFAEKLKSALDKKKKEKK